MLHFLLFVTSYWGGLIQAFRIAPVYLFLVYQTVYFFHPMTRWWDNYVWDISYSYYTVILMIFFVLFQKKKVSKTPVMSVPQFKWMYLLLFLYAITYFYAANQAGHWRYLEVFIKLVITMTVAFKLIKTIKYLDYALLGYIYGASYISFYIFQVGRNRGDRVEGIGMVDSPDANGVAAALAPALVLCVYYFWVAKHWYYKLAFLVATALIANALVLINSRGAFLAAFAGLLFFMGKLFFTRVKVKAQKVKIITFGVLGLIAAVSIMDDSFITRVMSITEETEVDTTRETGATRTIFWKASVDMSFDYPFGKGAKGFNYYAPIYIPKGVVVNATGSDDDRSKMKTVHSTWFEALSEVGYLGLFALLAMLRACFKTTKIIKSYLKKINAIEHYYKILALEGALISYMVGASFLNRMRAEVFYWLILFTACAYNVYILQKKGRRNDG